MLLFLSVAVSIICIAFLIQRRSRYIDPVDHPPDETAGPHLGISYPPRLSQEERDEADAEFDRFFYSGIWHFVDRYFHTKIAGASHFNSDGTNRVAIIKQCKPSELLVIQWDKGNKFDRYAKTVKRQNGQQLGYLQRHIAEDIHEDFFIQDVTWLGIFKCTTHHPETQEVVGAIILLARKTADKMTKAEAKIVEAERRESHERETIRHIRDAVRETRLTEPFHPADVNRALGITFAGTFLPKHRVGNPGGNTELFVQVARGLYRLRN